MTPRRRTTSNDGCPRWRHYAHLCDKTLANAVNNLLPDFGETEATNVAAIR